MPALYSHTTRATGTILTASIYNGDHQNHIDNGVPSQFDDYSASLGQMQTTTDPGEVGSESLATSLAGELERVRFALKEIKNFLNAGSIAQWYSTPSGVVALPSGTAANPSYTFASDLNTGMFNLRADELDFSIGGVRCGGWGGVTAAAASGSFWTPGFTSSATVLSGAPVTNGIAFNYFDINGDIADGTAGSGSKVHGLFVDHKFGDAGTKGGRHALMGRLLQNAPTSATNIDRNYVGVVGQAASTVGDGGTDFTTGSKGAYFGGNTYAQISGTATFVHNVCSLEANTLILTGASSRYRLGVASTGGGNVQGVEQDAAFDISNLGSATVAWRTGILFSNLHGSNALSASSQAIRISNTVAFTDVLVIDSPGVTGDILNYTDTTGVIRLRSTGSLELNKANAGLEIGRVTTASTPFVDFHSSGNNIDHDSRIEAAGGTTDIGHGELRYKAGLHRFFASVGGVSGESFRIGANATAVNFIQVVGAVTAGNGPQVQAEGSDTNIDLRLVPKGTGLVRFGTFTSSADVPVNGFVTIKDLAGTTIKLATVA